MEEQMDRIDSAERTPQGGKKKILLISVIAAVVVAAAAVILFVVLRSGKNDPNSYKGVTKSFMKALCAADGAEAAKYCIEPVREDVAEGINQMKALLMMGIKMSYKVGDSRKLSGDEIRDLEGRLKTERGYECSISQAYDVSVTLTLEVAGDSQSESQPLTLAKIDGTWYIADAF